jgi:hypothetical protein
VDLVEPVGAQQESAAVVEPGEGAFNDPAIAAEMGSVLGLAASDHRLDATPPEEPAVLVVVVAAIGEQRLRPATRPATTAAHRWDAIEQFEQLGDVVAVGGGQRPGERQPAAVYEQVVLAAAPAPVDRAGTRLRAPFFACR